MRKCGDCTQRCFTGWGGMIDYCMYYEMTTNEDEEIKTAAECPAFEEGTPSCLEDDEYCPSSTNRDYSPSNPWDAPGMSIKDFI